VKIRATALRELRKKLQRFFSRENLFFFFFCSFSFSIFRPICLNLPLLATRLKSTRPVKIFTIMSNVFTIRLTGDIVGKLWVMRYRNTAAGTHFGPVAAIIFGTKSPRHFTSDLNHSTRTFALARVFRQFITIFI